MNIVNKYAAMRAWYNYTPEKKVHDVQSLDTRHRESIVEYIKRMQLVKNK